jgi:hypothetical protein
MIHMFTSQIVQYDPAKRPMPSQILQDSCFTCLIQEAKYEADKPQAQASGTLNLKRNSKNLGHLMSMICSEENFEPTSLKSTNIVNVSILNQCTTFDLFL